jgi:hypothetical protein
MDINYQASKTGLVELEAQLKKDQDAGITGKISHLGGTCLNIGRAGCREILAE